MPRKPVNLDGQRFGMLTVQGITDQRNSYGRLLYRCKCDCGGERLATAANLKKGEVTNCGCQYRRPKLDLAGKRFGRLFVIKHTSVPGDTRKTYNWLCRCDCGNIVEVNGNSLTSGNTISCGCAHRDSVKSLYVDGTAPCKLTESKKPRKSNTSGVTGVSFNQSKQKWDAEIMLRGKKICLGRYGKKEDAIKARLLAEETYFGPILEQAEAETAEKDENSDPPAEPVETQKHPRTSMFSVGDVIRDWQVLCRSESYVSPNGRKHSQLLCRNVKTGERRIFPIFSLISMMRHKVAYLPADLVSPDGTVYRVERLTDFVRKHISEFSEGSDVPEEITVKRAVVGLDHIIATANGANKECQRYTYRGWSVKDPPVPRGAKRALNSAYLPVVLESPDGEVYRVESPLNFAREHVRDFFTDDTIPEDIAAKRIANGINQLTRNIGYSYKGWTVKKEGRNND